MARTFLTIVLMVLLSVFVGCGGVDSGRGQLMPARTKTSLGAAPVVEVIGAGEIDLVEQVAVNRQAYRQGLELLIEYYIKAGDNMKLEWARKELSALDTMPQYKYIIEAEVARSDLKARNSIPDADELYKDALQLEIEAGPLPFLKSGKLLRLALDKYNQLIKKYPSSDKIDDAAYRAGGIYDYFKDYTIALLYYQRAYQWDADTIHPARFKAAYLLDKRLHRRREALELYQQSVEKESQYKNYKEWAENRIRELTKSDEGGE